MSRCSYAAMVGHKLGELRRRARSRVTSRTTGTAQSAVEYKTEYSVRGREGALVTRLGEQGAPVHRPGAWTSRWTDALKSAVGPQARQRAVAKVIASAAAQRAEQRGADQSTSCGQCLRRRGYGPPKRIRPRDRDVRSRIRKRTATSRWSSRERPSREERTGRTPARPAPVAVRAARPPLPEAADRNARHGSCDEGDPASDHRRNGTCQGTCQ